MRIACGGLSMTGAGVCKACIDTGRQARRDAKAGNPNPGKKEAGEPAPNKRGT